MDTILKREDGSQVRISVKILEYWSRNGSFDYRTEVSIRESGKRKWVDAVNTHSWAYRQMSLGEREEHLEKEKLNYVTKEEIYQAKINAWESIKPKMDLK